MYFIKSLLIGALAVVAVSAQSSTTSSLIAFTTSPPSSVVAGELVVLGWEGGDPSQPVAITLRSGNADDLQIVDVVIGSTTGTSFTWPVPSNLADRNDYTLSISQGIASTEENTNYSGRFGITGGTVSSTSSSTSSRPSVSSVLQTALNSANATTTIASNNPSTTIGTGVVGTGASGAATGTGMSRNTTMSRPTLRSTSSSGASSTAAATTGTDPTGTSGGSGEETAPPDSSAMDAASFASPLALILSAVVAIVYLA
ncbi:MAG: hypothetical protein LQ341_006905 [Variospora aurantia]|nr:MAG: hypothetical protein LQ341_006905 [Variospora aurantia]